MNIKILLAVVGVAAVLVGASAIYYFAVYIPQQGASARVAVQEKQECATQGTAYAVEFKLSPDNVPMSAYWYSPEYHFNSKLNTCLVAMHFTWNTFDPRNQGLYDDESLVVDVNTNKTVLISWLDINPTASTTNFVANLPTDSPSNLSSADYKNQKTVLFTQ